MATPNPNARRILVVEDEPLIRRVFAETLKREGFEVDTAGNGNEAKDRIIGKEYDLLIVDIKMPEVNGFELYEHLRKRHPRLLERVIFTSGDVLGKDTELFLQRMGRPFLAKPFKSGQLIDLARKTMGPPNP